jgi:branched-chain amino acid transport system substrate-binding protein
MKFLTQRARRVLAPAVVLSLAALAAGCGGDSGSGGSSGGGDEYVIGASLPLTGPTTVYGANLAGGLEAYIKYVNDNGGVNGKKINLVQADGGFDTATTVQSLKKLAQSKPIAIGGLLVGSATEGAMPTIASLKIPALIASPVSTFNRPPANPYVFGAGGPVIEDEAMMISQFVQEKLVEPGQTPKVVTIGYNSNGSVLAVKNFLSEAKDNGWDVVDSEDYTTGTTNFDAQAAKIASMKPDLILYSSDSAGVPFIQALKNAGVTATIVTDQGGPHEDQLEALDYPSIHVLREIAYPTVGGDQATKDYLDRVGAVGGKVDPVSHVTQYGYLQAMILTKVLEKCGTDCDSQKFLDTMKTIGDIDTDGLTFGPFHYTEDNTAGLDTASFYTWDAAAKKVVLEDGTYTYPTN